MTRHQNPPGPLVDRIEVVYRNPADLAEDAGNPRTITAAAADRLRGGLEHFGVVEPLVFNRRTGELVSGHQRRQRALELGLPAVPVVEVDLAQADAYALGLLLNNDDAQGEWVPELLAARLDQLASVGALELAAFDPDTLASFGFGEPEEVDVSFKATRGRDPDTGERPAEPETQPGDIWELGEHRVVCADSFTLDVRSLLGGPVAVVVTDPPYAIFGSSTGVASDVTDDRMVRPFFTAVARASAAALDPHGHAYVHCDWRSWAALWEGFRAGGLAVRNMLVWDKNGSGLGSNYGNTHELVAFAHYVPKASNTFDNRRDSTYRPVLAPNVLRFNRPAGAERLHNAAKPVGLIEKLIENSTDEGALVLDLFAGSGSTLIAAENIGRRAVVVDHDGPWCDVIVERWRKLTGKRGRRRAGAAAAFITTVDAVHGDTSDTPDA